jgi:hypothetical protein
MELTTLDDYKDKVISLLATLVDSGYIKAPQYENYFSKIYFDAKVELKKQQAKDEKKMEAESRKDENSEDGERSSNYNYSRTNMDDYAILLLPFYQLNNNVPRFFNKLLQSRDEVVQMNTAVLFLRNRLTVPDSLLISLASKDALRGKLYSKLEKANKLDRFPSKYRNQPDIARSYLVADKDYDRIDSIALVGKQPAGYNGKRGVVYYFKYRVKKEDDWKIGLSGLQPEDIHEISSDDKLAVMTDKKLNINKPENEQFNEQLKRLLFNFHKSSQYFFIYEENMYRIKKIAEYGER